jgi:hypothetical protein
LSGFGRRALDLCAACCDETVAGQHVAATALLWRQHLPLVLGVQNQIANFDAQNRLLYSDGLPSRLPTGSVIFRICVVVCAVLDRQVAAHLGDLSGGLDVVLRAIQDTPVLWRHA